MDLLGSTKSLLSRVANNVINKAVKPYNIASSSIVLCGNLTIDGVINFSITEKVVAETVRGIDDQYITFTEKSGDLILTFTCIPTARANDLMKNLYRIQKQTKRYFSVAIFENGTNTDSYIGCILSQPSIEAGMEEVERTYQIGLIPLYDITDFTVGDTPEAVPQDMLEGG